MKYTNVKTLKEFQKLKSDIEKQLDDFIINYDQFTKSVSPSHWRSTGMDFSYLKNIRKDLKYLTPVTLKDLDSQIVRDEILTDEEKELWNATKSYNL